MSVKTILANVTIALLLIVQIIVSAVAYYALSTKMSTDSAKQTCILYQVKNDPKSYVNPTCDSAAKLFMISLIAVPLLALWTFFLGKNRRRALSFSISALHLILFFITLAGACLFFYGFRATAEAWSSVSVWEYISWYSTVYAGDSRIILMALEAAWVSAIVWLLLALIEFGYGFTTKTTVIKPGNKTTAGA